MGVTIRQATVRDSLPWLELLRASLSGEYQDKQVYEADWVVAELKPDSPVVTWVADNDDYLTAAVSILKAPTIQLTALQGSSEANSVIKEHIINLGRLLYRPEALTDGSLTKLLETLCQSADESHQILITRVVSSDKTIQEILESAGFYCLGFQPYKHLLRAREGILFYVRGFLHSEMDRAPMASASACT